LKSSGQVKRHSKKNALVLMAAIAVAAAGSLDLAAADDRDGKHSLLAVGPGMTVFQGPSKEEVSHDDVGDHFRHSHIAGRLERARPSSR
jgi:hypothetical protein